MNDYYIGQRVDALYAGEDAWYPGVIRSYNHETNTYCILYDDSEVENNVSSNLIRDHEIGTFTTGTPVLVRYGGGNVKYRGKISFINDDGGFDIMYDDGDTESNVPMEYVSEPSTSNSTVNQESSSVPTITLAPSEARNNTDESIREVNATFTSEDELTSVDELLETLTESWDDVNGQKQAISDLLRLIKSDEHTAVEICSRSGHRVIFSAIRLHKKSAALLSYGFVLLKKLCIVHESVQADFVTERMFDIVCWSMNTFRSDAILQASACGLISAVISGNLLKTTEAIPFAEITCRILSTMRNHSDLNKVSRQVHVYGCEALIAACEVGEDSVVRLICGKRTENFPGIHILCGVLRAAAHGKDQNVSISVCSALLCLTSHSKNVANLLRQNNVVKLIVATVAAHQEYTAIQKYMAEASQLIAISALQESSDPVLRKSARVVLRAAGEHTFLPSEQGPSEEQQPQRSKKIIRRKRRPQTSKPRVKSSVEKSPSFSKLHLALGSAPTLETSGQLSISKRDSQKSSNGGGDLFYGYKSEKVKSRSRPQSAGARVNKFQPSASQQQTLNCYRSQIDIKAATPRRRKNSLTSDSLKIAIPKTSTASSGSLSSSRRINSARSRKKAPKIKVVHQNTAPSRAGREMSVSQSALSFLENTPRSKDRSFAEKLTNMIKEAESALEQDPDGGVKFRQEDQLDAQKQDLTNQNLQQLQASLSTTTSELSSLRREMVEQKRQMVDSKRIEELSSNFEVQLQAEKDKCEQLEIKVVALNKSLKDKEESFTNLNEDKSSLEAKLVATAAAYEKDLQDLEASKSLVAEQKQLLAERSSAIETLNDVNSTQANELEDCKALSEAEIAELTSKLQGIREAETNRLKAETEKLKHDHSVVLEGLQVDFGQLKADLVAEKTRSKALEAAIEAGKHSSVADVQAMSQELSVANDSLSKALAKIKTLDSNAQKLKCDLKSSQYEVEISKKESSKRAKEIESLSQEHAIVVQELESKAAELDTSSAKKCSSLEETVKELNSSLSRAHEEIETLRKNEESDAKAMAQEHLLVVQKLKDELTKSIASNEDLEASVQEITTSLGVANEKIQVLSKESETHALELEKKSQDHTLVVQRLEKELKKASEVASNTELEASVKELKSSLAVANEKIQALSKESETHALELEKKSQDHTLVVQRLENELKRASEVASDTELEASVKELKSSLAIANEKIQVLSKESEARTLELKEASQKHSVAVEKLEGELVEAKTLGVNVQELTKSLNVANEKVENLTKDSENRAVEFKETLQKHSLEVEQLKAELSNEKSKSLELQSSLITANDKIEVLTKESDDRAASKSHEQEVSKLQDELQQCQEQLKSITNKVADKENENRELQVELETLFESTNEQSKQLELQKAKLLKDQEVLRAENLELKNQVGAEQQAKETKPSVASLPVEKKEDITLLDSSKDAPTVSITETKTTVPSEHLDDAKNWVECHDEDSGSQYFYNKVSKESVWRKPTCLVEASRRFMLGKKSSKNLLSKAMSASENGTKPEEKSEEKPDVPSPSKEAGESTAIAHPSPNFKIEESKMHSHLLRRKSVAKEWVVCHDEATGNDFYYDTVSKVSIWEKPACLDTLVEAAEEYSDDTEDTAAKAESVDKFNSESYTQPAFKFEDSSKHRGLMRKNSVATEWVVCTDENSGRPYYYDTVKKISVWEKPKCLEITSAAEDTSRSPAKENDEPEGAVVYPQPTFSFEQRNEHASRRKSVAEEWIKCVDESSGNRYYYDTVTKVSTWNIPECLSAIDESAESEAEYSDGEAQSPTERQNPNRIIADDSAESEVEYSDGDAHSPTERQRRQQLASEEDDDSAASESDYSEDEDTSVKKNVKDNSEGSASSSSGSSSSDSDSESDDSDDETTARTETSQALTTERDSSSSENENAYSDFSDEE